MHPQRYSLPGDKLTMNNSVSHYGQISETRIEKNYCIIHLTNGGNSERERLNDSNEILCARRVFSVRNLTGAHLLGPRQIQIACGQRPSSISTSQKFREEEDEPQNVQQQCTDKTGSNWYFHKGKTCFPAAFSSGQITQSWSCYRVIICMGSRECEMKSF